MVHIKLLAQHFGLGTDRVGVGFAVPCAVNVRHQTMAAGKGVRAVGDEKPGVCEHRVGGYWLELVQDGDTVKGDCRIWGCRNHHVDAMLGDVRRVESGESDLLDTLFHRRNPNHGGVAPVVVVDVWKSTRDIEVGGAGVRGLQEANWVRVVNLKFVGVVGLQRGQIVPVLGDDGVVHSCGNFHSVVGHPQRIGDHESPSPKLCSESLLHDVVAPCVSDWNIGTYVSAKDCNGFQRIGGADS